MASRFISSVKTQSWFIRSLAFAALVYLGLILLLVFGNLVTISFSDIREVLQKKEILQSLVTTLASCTLSTFLAILFGVPIAYLFSRFRFRGKLICESLLDVPLVLPPIVVGLCLLIVFNKLKFFGSSLDDLVESLFGVTITFQFGAVVLAQCVVTTALVIQLLRPLISMVPYRYEELAMLHGATSAGAFFRVVLPEVKKGLFGAATLAWAKAFGEFGPILVFAGAIRGRTEVLSTSVFMELNTGNLGAALAIAFLMILVSMAIVLLVNRLMKKEEYA